MDPRNDWYVTSWFFFRSTCRSGTSGCCATFIITLFPPKSGRKAVRLRTADSIDALGHIYTTLMSAWITESEAENGAPSTSASNWIKAFRRRLIAATAQLQSNKQQMMLASWEGSIRGRWPQEEYVKLTEVQEEIIAIISQVCDIGEM